MSHTSEFFTDDLGGRLVPYRTVNGTIDYREWDHGDEEAEERAQDRETQAEKNWAERGPGAWSAPLDEFTEQSGTYPVHYLGRVYLLTDDEINAFAEAYGPEVAAGEITEEEATYLFLMGAHKIHPDDDPGNALAAGQGAVE